MVMTSQQIAAMSSQFNQQTSMQMQHAGQLSQFAGGMAQRPDRAAERLTGSAINTGAAIGAPVAMGGMMLAGVDPVTMGAKAAWGARGAGALGAGAAGMAAAAPLTAGIMGAQYVGGQMMQGVQEQQNLNTQLRGAYGHMNQYGGRGFASNESRQIGQQFRGMTQDRGPGGEFTTMDELGRLAGGMGRMGMAQGVRDAKDFTDKFKQMLKTVKTVAKAFSTSLEEAQKVMSSMRGAGVFGNANQGAFAQLIRKGAAGSGVATQEMSQIANIGSQISRSVGGRGRSGAVAGIRTMSNIGAAVKSGVLSEEDIYNQTGQTGAAGRQAMASSMMQQEARFFKGGLGRRVLASMANKEGEIDQKMAERYMSGEMSTGGTMKEAYGHLGKVGRANFIRNEGRLRGEAMAAFGGMGRATVAQGWLSKRGMDLYNMDDRNMLFFQRKFKMDRDQADNTIKMAKNLGTIRTEQKEGNWEDETMRSLEMSQRTSGMEGVKRKLEDGRNAVQGALRELGAGYAESIRDSVESVINQLTGNYVRRVERDLGGAITDLKRGNLDSAKREMGVGLGPISRGQRAEVEKLYGSKLAGGVEWVEQNKAQYEKAGWDMSGDVRGKLEQMRSIQKGVAEGFKDRDIMGEIIPVGTRVDKKGKTIGPSAAEQRKDTPQYQQLRSMMSGMTGGGDKRLRGFRDKVMSLEGEEFDALKKEVSGANDESLSRIYGEISKGTESGDPLKGFGSPKSRELLTDVLATSQGSRAEAVSEYIFTPEGGEARSKGIASAKKEVFSLGNVLRSAHSSRFSGDLTSTQAVQRGFEEGVKEYMGGYGGAAQKGAAAILDTDAAIEIAETTQRGTKEERSALLERLQNEQQSVGKNLKDMSASEQEEDLARKMQMAAVRTAQGESSESVASSLGLPKGVVDRAGKTQQTQLVARDIRRQRQAAVTLGKSYLDQSGAIGNMTDEQTREALKEKGLKGKELDAAVKQASEERDVINAGASMGLGLEGIGEGGDPFAKFGREVSEAGEGRHEQSDKALQAMVDLGYATDETRATLSARRSFGAAKKSRKKGAGLQTLAAQMGGELGEDEAKRIFGMKDTKEQAAAFKKATGGASLSNEELMKTLASLKKGDVKGTTEGAEGLGSTQVRAELKKAREDKQDASATVNDPSFRALTGIEKNTSGMIKVLAAISTSTQAAADGLKNGKDKPTE